MRKLFFLLLLMFTVNVSNAQSYIRTGNTFTSTSSKSKSASTSVKTKFTWKNSKGVEYPIYVSSNGSCFTIKVSAKTKKEYKSYMKPEVSQEICRELKIVYKPKTNK